MNDGATCTGQRKVRLRGAVVGDRIDHTTTGRNTGNGRIQLTQRDRVAGVHRVGHVDHPPLVAGIAHRHRVGLAGEGLVAEGDTVLGSSIGHVTNSNRFVGGRLGLRAHGKAKVTIGTGAPAKGDGPGIVRSGV